MTFTLEKTLFPTVYQAINAMFYEDINHDGYAELVIAGPEALAVYNSDASVLLWKSEPLGHNSGKYNNIISRGLDNDSCPEIIIGSDAGLYFFK